MRWSGIACTAAMLAGCGQGGTAQEAASVDMVTAPTDAAAPAAPRAVGATPGASETQRPTPVSVTAPLLAYRHTVDVEAPAKAIRPLLARHESACVAAGPTVCQVIKADSDSVGRDQVQASLELRARPDWLRAFRGRLEGDAEGAGGRVTGSSTETEDLTRAIVDTEAQLRAKTTLRNRLEALLASRPGKLEEVLQVEQELARVQGEINSGQSQLAVMRTRVSTSALQIAYASRGAPVADGVFAPLSDASNGFVRNIVAGFAAILTVLSWLLPFAVVLGGLAWLAVRLRRRFGPKTKIKTPLPSGEAPPV